MNKRTVVSIGLALTVGFTVGVVVGWRTFTVTDDADPQPPRAATGNARLYVKIPAVQRNGNVDMQLVEWATGDTAEQVAFEEGACSLRAIEDDECTPNGFFVRVTNKVFTLPLSPDVRIELYDWMNPEGPTLSLVSREDFINDAQIKYRTETSPFIITTHGGVIMEIQEQYVP